MAKARKKSETRWTDGLDKSEVDAALEDAIVDAYGEGERPLPVALGSNRQ
jgi:hypothetical protein